MADPDQTPAGPSAADFAALQQRYEASESARQAAEQRAAETTRRAAGSDANRFAAEEMAADSQIAGLKSEIDRLEGEMADLNAEGKFREAAAIQTKLSTTASRLDRLEAVKPNITAAKQSAVEAANRPADPVENFLSTTNFNDDEKSWIRRNTRYATDPAFKARVDQAHNDAVGKQNLSRGSTDYYRFLENAGYERQEATHPAPRREQPAADATGDEIDTGEGSPYSDTGADHALIADGVEIIIGQEPAVEQQPAPIPEGARPANPQQRAAGTAPGSSIAAAPTRRPLSGQRAVQGQTRHYISPEEAELAFNTAQTVEPKIAAEGMPAVAKWWLEWKNSKSANEKRARWAAGG